MDLSEIGLPTYHTRVEAWECDYNDHWNVRFYGRSFQAASETVAARTGAPNPGAATIRSRQMRFHGELRVAAPVEIRSAKLVGAGELDGAVIHLMLSRGRLAATALDLPGGVDGLPAISPEDVPLALPRGITGPVFGAEVPPGPQVVAVEMGPIRTEDLDHTGALRFDHVIRHASTLQHTLLNAVGLTQDYADTARINRMGVEFRVTLTGAATPPAGALLRGQTWIPRVSDKRFWAANRITTAEGDLLALVDMCLVTVNLDTRKAVDVPDFMYSSLAG